MTARECHFDVLGQLPGLRRYARSLTRNDIDAEDLVHDAIHYIGNQRAWAASIALVPVHSPKATATIAIPGPALAPNSIATTAA